MMEEKFFKKKTRKEILVDSLEFLEKSNEAVEEFKFNFACFVDSFKKVIIKNGNK